MIRINPFVVQLYVYRPFCNLRYVRLAIPRHISPVQCIRSLFGLNPWRRASYCPDVADTAANTKRKLHFVTLMWGIFPSYLLIIRVNLEWMNFPRTIARIIIDMNGREIRTAACSSKFKATLKTFRCPFFVPRVVIAHRQPLGTVPWHNLFHWRMRAARKERPTRCVSFICFE